MVVRLGTRFCTPILQAPLPTPLSPTRRSSSNVARGQSYEKACLAYLKDVWQMDLARNGGAGDQGIDLIGSWDIGHRLDVLVQCKHYRKKVGPNTIREMDGTAAHFTSHPHKGVVSIVCASSGFSDASWQRAAASKFPMLLLHLTLQNPTSSPTTGDVCRCTGVWRNPAFLQVTNGCILVEESMRLTDEGYSRYIAIVHNRVRGRKSAAGEVDPRFHP